MNSSPPFPLRLIHRMSCPHCETTLRIGTRRCPSCFGKIAYRKARIRSRVLRLLVLALMFTALFLSGAAGRTEPVRIVLNLIIFTVCAVGLWNHRPPEADAGKSAESDL